MKELKFYRCNVCGNLAVKLVDSGVKMHCCGKEMQEYTPNTTDGAVEKHLPVISEKCGNVDISVGSVSHPMTEEHYIQFIVLQTSNGYYFKELNPNDLPKATFTLSKGEKVISAYSFCNLHGLWKKQALKFTTKKHKLCENNLLLMSFFIYSILILL